MAELDDPDFELDVLYGVNGLADGLPGWARSAVTLVGEWGLPLVLVGLVLVAWLLVRRRPDAAQAVPGCLWALLAAGVTCLANVPIRSFVARSRPHENHPDLTVLIPEKDGYSFVSDHAGVAMAIAVGLFLVHRTLGLLALALALAQGVARVVLGVHYPTDVVGGYALGMAVALLLAPLALAALTPLVRLGAGTRWLGWLLGPSGTAASRLAGGNAAVGRGPAQPAGTGRPARSG
ncbi:phosphatase PAP2 family protein [Streptomyces sp. DSM 44915]|uniref:Phosphatase PAP2 family protein n=1 Tax=Streptomyces chisholmiae TaxID=3075540 RepID=A0ABU2JZJ8_9ACTN|nr:phosphatase PAP2 family protein [Streptomyces sp. DSM 44915]MDT0270377.1 phosphatase PAP2 family protein [Streptomyces sp. DSM 44915]